MEEKIYYAVVALQIELLVIALIVLLPKMKLNARKMKNPCFVDTSVLIDGRISHAAGSGFIPRNLVIPKSVLAELQFLADGSDSEKRTRARHGLDVANDLQSMAHVNVTIMDDGEAKKGVDEQLIILAKKHNGTICTIDYNLNKVATVEGVRVLNINELAKELRMDYLPGERITLAIAQKGNDAGQGVGYLADGTMVVVEKAQSDLNSEVEIEFIRSIQTAAGRMLFAKKVGSTQDSRHKTQDKPAATGARESNQAGNKPSSAKPYGRRKSKAQQSEDSLIRLANDQ